MKAKELIIHIEAQLQELQPKRKQPNGPRKFCTI